MLILTVNSKWRSCRSLIWRWGTTAEYAGQSENWIQISNQTNSWIPFLKIKSTPYCSQTWVHLPSVAMDAPAAEWSLNVNTTKAQPSLCQLFVHCLLALLDYKRFFFFYIKLKEIKMKWNLCFPYPFLIQRCFFKCFSYSFGWITVLIGFLFYSS